MSIPQKELKILLIRSGGKCAFPGCPASLVAFSGIRRNPVITGQIAHIVSSSPDGPRGGHILPPGQHDKHTNLIGLCSEHHTIIDAEAHVYTVERLRQMKQDHEEAVVRVVAQVKAPDRRDGDTLSNVRETVHSTLLPAIKMPRFIYGAPCTYTDAQEREAAKEVAIPDNAELCPFVIREGNMLYAFNDLRLGNGPFRNLVDTSKARSWRSEKWWEDPDKYRWYVTLLNRTLNKLTGRKGLRLDKEHHRYYFQSEEAGKALEVSYRPLNQQSTTRQAVWQPRSKKTGSPRPYWTHLAVSLRFLWISGDRWCLCIRPELRITRDGFASIEAESIGSHVTRRKSHLFNYDLLEDVNFWRDFLSGGRPRIFLNFGGKQSLVISTTLMASEVFWPGIPQEFAMPFRNIEYEEDLFSAAELSELTEESGEDTEPPEDDGDQEEASE